MFLNLISFFGLFVMIGLAWLMSSHRTKVNWRLVIYGVFLQMLFAGIFFNSQSWKFPRSFDSFDALMTSVENEKSKPANVPLTFREGDQTPESFAVGYKKFQAGDIDQAQLKTQFWDNRGASEKTVEVPRFSDGVVFYAVESFFELIKLSVSKGAEFDFNVNAFPAEGDGPTKTALMSTFAFGVLPTVIFFAALMSILYYLGFMQKVIRVMAWVMQKTLRTSPSESLAAAANVLVGHTEAPLVVKPYIATMTRSELNALMVGGFATISGSLMAVFAGIGISAGHLLTASIISAPAALVLAKIMQPETEKVMDLSMVESRIQYRATNVIEAAADGASEGMKLAINIAAMLIAFLALIAFLDTILQWIGSYAGVKLSISIIFGYLFYPLAWVMGITSDDCLIAGNLLGEKIVVNEFLAYFTMSGIPVQEASANADAITPRTRVIMTYALCGFSNFGAIGIQLGGIGPLAPERKSDLAQLGLRAMLGGMLAACMTACIAGVYFGWLG